MTKKRKIFILILPIFFNNAILGIKSSPYVITFFLKPQTELSSPQADPANANEIQNHILNTIHNVHPQAGTYATYNGNATVSDMNGQITFLRQTVEPKIHLLITEEIEPLLINPYQKNIIEGFVLEPDIKHKFYLLEQHKNKDTNDYEWTVQEKVISKSKKIPYNTIILFANPENALISSVNKTVKMDGNLLLPDVYIKSNSDLQLNALSFLKIRQYFSRVKKKYEFKPGLYQERII